MTSLLSVPKVGPKYKELLEKLEIFSVEDLLYHFPFRYDDFSMFKKAKEVIEGEFVTVQGILGPVQNIFTKGGKRITKASLVDFTGSIDLIWFNQHYLKTVLKTGKKYNFSGKVSNFNSKPCLFIPDFEEVGEMDDKYLNTGRLVPIYPETAGISSKWLRTRINDVLKRKLNMGEFLPTELLNSQALKDFEWSLNEIHFPDGLTEATHAHKRFEFEEFFVELLNVEKRKSEWSSQLKGIKFKPFSNEVAKLIQSLPFKLTDSQTKAVEEIVDDTQNTHPMNRLLEGDVGTGKTIVALISAYLAHLNGYKTLYMAPTEILAEQHFETFKKFLSEFDVTIEIATGTKKPKGDNESWDILIGTHAILFNPETYKKIGLVVIDEQHRFGVEQRGKLTELSNGSKTPHLLAMTATPIPRTLALTLYGDLSISTLDIPPNKDKKITTKVVTDENRMKAYEWIREKNEPTFIVCPFIMESENTTLDDVKAAQVEYIKLKDTVFKNTTVGLLHGRMKPKEKEEIIGKFRNGEIKVLVSTPVIEVGIDIPDATIMVIESAERYGLASLHQLRGRVGRGTKEGFCFTILSTDSEKSLTRLKHLEEISNGLELAEIDMRMRGQGDLFGTMQHGSRKFKIASLDNLELLQKAKLAAQEYYPKLDNYPKLKEHIIAQKGSYIKAN